MAETNPTVIQLKSAIDQGCVMPNVPQVGGFFSSVGTALRLATQGRVSVAQALQDAAASIRDQ